MELVVNNISSPDIGVDEIPNDGHVLIFGEIRVKGENRKYQVSFVAMTFKYAMSLDAAMWGKGKLLLPELSWLQIDALFKEQITKIKANTYHEMESLLDRQFVNVKLLN